MKYYKEFIFKNINHLESSIRNFYKAKYRNILFLNLTDFVFILKVNNNMIKNISKYIVWDDIQYPNKLNFKYGTIKGWYTIYIHESPAINTLTITPIHKKYIEKLKEKYYDKYNK